MKIRLLFYILPFIFMACSDTGTDEENIVYPGDLKAIVDITQPPYSADNTGKEDCTEILIRAIDDITGKDIELMERSKEILRSDNPNIYRADTLSFEQRQEILKENPEAIIGFERIRGTFPYTNPPARILYFPNGTYRVSNTITYSHPNLQNRPGKEMNRMIHIRGESESGVVIRLEDDAEGFGEGTGKPVISFTSGNPSNISMQNSCENLTIEIGAGNPGAVGLEFFANNTGAVRHVSIRSLDPERKGYAGLAIRTDNSSCALISHVSVDGLDYGILMSESRLYSVAEHLTLRNQRKAGFLLGNHNVGIRGMNSMNEVPALRMKGPEGTLALIDCEFKGGKTGQAAIDFQEGFLMARNISTSGYGSSLLRQGDEEISEAYIEEWVSHDGPKLYPGQVQSSLNLPVEETPDVPWVQDMDEWVSVNEFGARGDGLHDDTEAIQQAMNSGRKVVYFQPGTYLIDRSIDVPETVQRVNFMYCDLVAGDNLQKQEGAGTFKVTGESDNPVVFEDLFAFERYFGAHYLINHASRRPVILSDLHTQVGAMYKNSVPGGKVFIENVCCTDQFPPYKNCFYFKEQQVWARQLNPERSNPEVLNEGGKLWVLGFKTEKSGCGYQTVKGGQTEILGGIFNISRSEDSSPMVITDHATVSVFAATTDHEVRPAEWNLRPFVMDIRDGDTTSLNWNHFPFRDEHLIVLPLYTNIKEGLEK